MKRNCLFINMVLFLTIVIFAYGCTPTRTNVKQEPAKQKSAFKKPRPSPLIFNVLHVEVTKEEQYFVDGFDARNFQSVQGKHTPNEGNSFVIVSYSIKNTSALKVELKRSEFVLIDSSGSSAKMAYGKSFYSSPSKLIWGYYDSRTLPPHFQEEDKELFIVKDDFVQGLKVIFYGKEYPLQLPTLSK